MVSKSGMQNIYKSLYYNDLTGHGVKNISYAHHIDKHGKRKTGIIIGDYKGWTSINIYRSSKNSYKMDALCSSNSNSLLSKSFDSFFALKRYLIYDMPKAQDYLINLF